MPDSPLTQRDVEALRTTVDKLDQTLTNLPDRIEQTYVRKETYQRDIDRITEDVEAHQAWLEWAQKIVLGLVIVGLVGLLIASRVSGIK